MDATLYHLIKSTSPTDWTWSCPAPSPFLKKEFFSALEQNRCIGKGTGWEPQYLFKEQEHNLCGMYFFEKYHSYGEYIFDWEWANAFHQNNIAYYPKLTSMIPFTPVTTSHFLMKQFDKKRAHILLDNFEKYYFQGAFSSAHFLFLTSDEVTLFGQRNYIIRESIQYHFFNHGFKDFDHFLLSLKSKKAKQIKKERNFPENLKINVITGSELSMAHALEMFNFYSSTILNKGAIAYLNQDFFVSIFDSMKSNVLYVQAQQAEQSIAGALYFYDRDRLYGRYWGSLINYPNLHFELCYYQGIDFCLKNKLSVFEAGAQGEHKIGRGFWPIKTYSAHHIKNDYFQSAIADYVDREKIMVDGTIEELRKMLPFKKMRI